MATSWKSLKGESESGQYSVQFWTRSWRYSSYFTAARVRFNDAFLNGMLKGKSILLLIPFFDRMDLLASTFVEKALLHNAVNVIKVTCLWWWPMSLIKRAKQLPASASHRKVADLWAGSFNVRSFPKCLERIIWWEKKRRCVLINASSTIGIELMLKPQRPGK